MAAWLALVAVALVTRPLIPVDETRYLSVAWEMWLRGDWLVPHLNGVPYPDKPPLLFWLILAGWRVGGVSAWWPRLIGPLVALGSVALTMALARRLWPGRPAVARATPAFLFVLLWAAYATFVLFDLPLTATVLLGALGIVIAWRGRPLIGWPLAGLALGLGVLAKGPIAFLHVLPVGLLAPWWAREPRPRSWLGWYAGLAAAVALGAGLALAWALPAAAHGGPAYGDAILWHQTADRMVRAFAHPRPLWWYLPLLPLLFFPWSVWPPLWNALRRLGQGASDAAARFCAVWIGTVLAGLSLISGKQVHYVIPLIPPFALIAARAMADAEPTGRRRDLAPAAALLALAGAVLALPAAGGVADRLPPWAAHGAPWWALAPLLGAAAMMASQRADAQRTTLAALASGLLLVLHLAVVRPGRADLDLAPAGAYFRALEDAGRPVAFVGRYAGQFHFLGRLRRPFVLLETGAVRNWAAAHAGGIVACLRRRPGPERPAFAHRYLDQQLLAFPAAAADGCVPAAMP